MDIVFHNHGSVFVVEGTSKAGIAWLQENLDQDGQRWGLNGYVVEPRYVAPILAGAVDSGLDVS